MEHHKITCRKDIEELQKVYENDSHFEVLETGEEITLPDFLYLYDNQQITIQHI